MLTIHRKTRCRILDSEVGFALSAIPKLERLFIGVIIPAVKQFVGDDDFRLRHYEFTSFGPMDMFAVVAAFFNDDRLGLGEKIRQAAGGFGVWVSDVIPQIGRIALTHYDDAVSLPRECRVK